jgi:EmrB/QacA subfamily drug resistance transporter
MTTTAANDRSRWIALYVLCLGMLMIVLDGTVVTVALPTIQHELDFTQSGLAWVLNAYLIAFGGLLLLAGRLGDLISHRGMFLAGLALFTTASLVCGLAVTPAMLVIARFVQGVGGAMTSAVILGMIVTMFPERQEQAKAIGIYAFVASAGGSIGLILGGVIAEAISWHWIFFVNIPIGIATGLAAVRLLPADRGLGFGEGVDVLGAVLITAALMLGVYTLVSPASEKGWGATETLLLGAGALVLLAAFIAREATARHPLMPLRLFRSRNVSGANLIQALTVAGMFGMFFMGSLYLQRVLHYDPLEIGLAFLPTTIAMGLLSARYSERLVMRFGAGRTLLGGLALLALGMAWFTQIPANGNYWVNVLPVMLLVGAGAGSSFPALMNIAMSGATRSDAGLASGLVNTTMQVGGALGLSVLATLATTRTADLARAGNSPAEAFTGGVHVAFYVALGLVLASLTVAVVVLRAAAEPAKEGEPVYETG